MAEFFFKVLAEDMRSIGLLNAPKLKYKLDRWTKPLEPLSDHPRKGGGLWITRKLGQARAMKRYAERRGYCKAARIFECRIGRILYESSCRVKTSKVMLVAEIIF